MGSLSQIGEMTLLEKIQKWCDPTKIRSYSEKINSNFTVQVPLGDDAFVAKLATNFPLVVTTDTLIEGTHFNFDWFSAFLSEKEVWRSLGYKAMAVNLSDFAAMGNVKPLFAFVTIGLNGDISVDSVDNLYTGMKILSNKYNFIVAGGDVIRSEKSIISINLIGQLNSFMPITRSGAKIGDVLMVSGHIGCASAGLEILKKRLKLTDFYRNSLIQAQILPRPQLEQGKILSNRDILATSLIDTSDDLVTSLEILSKKSKVGFELNLDLMPVHSALLNISKRFKVSPYKFILYGGEDYQLLFTVHPSKVDLVKKRIPNAFVIGKVKPNSFGIQIKMGHRPFKLKDSRFKHF